MRQFEELAGQAWNLNRPADTAGERTDPVESHFVEVGHWLYRIGNSRDPDQYETVIQVLGKTVRGKAIGAYIEFHRDPGRVLPPGYKADNRMLYVNYGFDQLPQVREVLNLIGERPVWLLYHRYEKGHRWAELFHDWLPGGSGGAPAPG